MTGNLIHIRVDNSELVSSKRDILSTEANLIQSLQILKKYHFLRMNELRLKARFLRKLKETKSEIKKLEEVLPKPEIPKILKKVVEHKKEVFTSAPKKDNLESQLEEIQRKLRELERM